MPELIMLGMALVGALTISFEILTEGNGYTWRSATRQGEVGFSLAGLWYYFIAAPIFQFFLYRWLWRLLIWTLFLGDLSRLPLRLVATVRRQLFLPVSDN